MTDACHHNTTCRVCGSNDLVKVLDLGMQPLANAYLRADQLDQPEARYPLALYFCRGCSLAQLLDVVDPAVLFGDYHFLTSASAPSVEHFALYARETIRPLINNSSDLVVEIGGNDGTLLGNLRNWCRLLNIDPAANLAPLSEAKGVSMVAKPFTSKLAVEIAKVHGCAQVVVANNVLAHIDNISDVLAGICMLLREDGTLIFEVHWADDLIASGHFDLVYHEHLCFWSLHALKRALDWARLVANEVEIVPTQGKSLRVFASQGGEQSPEVANVLEVEREHGLTTEAAYHAFALRAQQTRDDLIALLADLKAAGKRIAGYGAPAKSTVLLNFCGIGRETLDYLTDTTPLKQGMFAPGTHLPIIAPEQMRANPPDYLLLLAWNFKDRILAQEHALRERGVRFITVMPEVEIL